MVLEAFKLAQEQKQQATTNAAPDKFCNLQKAVSRWQNALPAQETFTDFLRASGLYFTCPREFVLNYWQPRPNRKFDAKSQFLMGMGTHLHEFIQNAVLGPMGVLKGEWFGTGSGSKVKDGYHPDPEKAIWEITHQQPLSWAYHERRVWLPQYRIRGHVDGVISIDRVQWLHDNSALFRSDPARACKVLLGIPPGPECLLEIKTTGDYQYSKIVTSADIPPYYKMQGVIYQEATGLRQTVFWYVNRDSAGSKVLTYTYEPGWLNDAKRKATAVWEAIRDETLPDIFMPCKSPKDKRAKACVYREPCWARRLDFAKYVADGKAQAALAGRQLLDLSQWRAPA